MQIGAVAKKMGLRVDAIRFYEHSSLLPRRRGRKLVVLLPTSPDDSRPNSAEG